MQGINILVDKFSNSGGSVYREEELLFQNSRISISKNIPYPHYPVAHWENDQFLFVVEGFFFEWADYRQRIEQFAERYFNSTDKNSLLANYFSGTDAEFVVLIHNKPLDSTIIFNDVLGRLPLYFSDSKQYLFISRNVSFIAHFHKLNSDSRAFLETLALGFTLGTKTLYTGISRITGGTVIEISNNSFESRQYHVFNYEQLIDKQFDPNEAIEETASLFIDALKNRSRFADLNILALSGGLDSRAVAGGLRLSALPYRLMAYSDAEGHARRDIPLAFKIAEKQNLPLTVIDLPDPSKADFELMFGLKYGLSALDMTYLVNFYRTLTPLSNRLALFTGDGGDKVFPDLTPGAFFKSPESIANYAIRSNSKMDPTAAAGILGKNRNDLWAECLDVMHSYPESDWQLKYVHFLMENRVSNWLVEGEDRNRCFLTSFTPFYHARLFKILMSAPPGVKKDFALYDRFLKVIAPETYRIANANWGFDVSQKRKIRWIYFKQDLKKTRMGIQIARSRQREDNHMTKLTSSEKDFFSEMVSLPLIRETFDIDLIKKIKYFNSDSFLHVLTLMKVQARNGKNAV